MGPAPRRRYRRIKHFNRLPRLTRSRRSTGHRWCERAFSCNARSEWTRDAPAKSAWTLGSRAFRSLGTRSRLLSARGVLFALSACPRLRIPASRIALHRARRDRWRDGHVGSSTGGGSHVFRRRRQSSHNQASAQPLLAAASVLVTPAWISVGFAVRGVRWRPGAAYVHRSTRS